MSKTLTQSFYNAFEKILTAFEEDENAKLEGKRKQLLEGLSNDLAEGVKDWIVKQPFRIQKMKAVLEVEDIQTTGPRFADVLPSVQVTVPPGINTAGSSATGGPTLGATTSPMVSPVTAGTQGVMLPKLSLKKSGGDGGILIAKGHAYIGDNPVGATNEGQTEVRLIDDEAKDV